MLELERLRRRKGFTWVAKSRILERNKKCFAGSLPSNLESSNTCNTTILFGLLSICIWSWWFFFYFFFCLGLTMLYYRTILRLFANTYCCGILLNLLITSDTWFSHRAKHISVCTERSWFATIPKSILKTLNPFNSKILIIYQIKVVHQLLLTK